MTSSNNNYLKQFSLHFDKIDPMSECAEYYKILWSRAEVMLVLIFYPFCPLIKICDVIKILIFVSNIKISVYQASLHKIWERNKLNTLKKTMHLKIYPFCP